MTPLVKGIGVLFGLPLLLGMVFFSYFISTGEQRMRLACGQIKPGMTFPQLTEIALAHNLSAPEKGVDVTYLHEMRNFGTHACRIDFETGFVKNAGYSHSE